MGPDNGSLPMGPDDAPSEPALTLRAFVNGINGDGTPRMTCDLAVEQEVPARFVVDLLRVIADQLETQTNVVVIGP